jgi:hypothetical protein
VSSFSLTIPAELVESIAARVVELVTDGLPAPATEEGWHLVDVEEAAGRLTRSTRWVRDHKDEIGYVRLDGGAFAFEVDDLRRFAQERRVGGEPLAGLADPLHTDGFPVARRSGRQKAGLESDQRT